MSIKQHWALAALLGAAVAAFGLYILDAFPQERLAYPEGYGAPVYAFEMARTKADLIAIFGTPDDPERATRIAQMDRGNLLDYPFMVLYGLFIAAFFRAAARQSGAKVWLVFAGLGIAAALADGIENQILLGLTADLEAAPNLALLTYPVWFKFLSLMVCGVAAGLFIVRQPGLVWTVLGALAALAPLTTIPAFIDPPSYAALIGTGATVCWVIKLIFAGTQAITRSA